MHDDGDVYMGEYKPPFAMKLMKCDGYIKIGLNQEKPYRTRAWMI